MKRLNLSFTVALFFVLVFFFANTTFAQVKIEPKQPSVSKVISQEAQNSLKNGVVAIKKIDLAAYAVNVSVVSCKSKYDGKVKITGVVKNVGNMNYISGAKQQMALLYEVPQSGQAKLVASQTFQNLSVGAEVTVSYITNWYKANEFPSSYKLIISYDPDILLDSNKNNDDSVSGNNNLTKTAADINNMINYPCN